MRYFCQMGEIIKNMNSIDITVQNYIETIRAPLLTDFFYPLSAVFDVSLSTVLVCLATIVLIYLFCGRYKAFLFSGTISIGVALSTTFKLVFDTVRPVGGLFVVSGPSFPSYHATIVTIFFICLMYIFDSHLPKLWRVFFNVFSVLIIFLVSFSRIYLGVHWFSDVIGGFVLGFVISISAIYIFKSLYGQK